MPNNKLYFITDAHLGAGADTLQREKELCQLLERMKEDAAMVIFLGDMFDFWFTYRHVVPKGFTRLFGQMAQLADAGVELHYFIGNHDMWMFHYLEEEMAITMHDDPAVLEYDGKRFLIGHGDGLGHLDKKFDLLRKVFRSPLNQRLFTLLPSSWMFPIAHRWSDNNKELHAKEDCLHYLGDEREGIVLYCKERLRVEQFDYCLFGHRHTPLVKPLADNCTYINTGDWFFNRNYAVFNPLDHTLKLYDLQKGEITGC